MGKVSRGPLVVTRDGKGVREAEGLQRYRGVVAWKEWVQVHHPFGQEAVKECVLREKKGLKCIQGYSATCAVIITIQGLLVSFPVCHGLGTGPNTYLFWC